VKYLFRHYSPQSHLLIRLRESRRTVLVSLLLWALFVTLLRGVRRPNDWAEAHWLIGYNMGVVKRGLPGSMLEPVRAIIPEAAEQLITIVSSAILAVLFLVLVVISGRILRLTSFSSIAIISVAVFCTSPFIVMSGHLNGYFDAQIILISIFALWLTLQSRQWIAAVIMSIGVLIHENIFVIGLPATLWVTLLLSLSDEISKGWNIVYRLAPFLLPIGIFGVLVYFHSFIIDNTDLENMLITSLQNFAFIQHDQEIIVPRALSKSFVGHFISQSPRVWGRLFDSGLIATILPNVIVLLLFVRNILKTRLTPRYLIAAGLVLPFYPLSLLLIAWDTERIWTYSIIVSFMVLWASIEVTEPDKLRTVTSRSALALGMLVLPINIFSQIPLMDWRVERFSSLWRIVLYSPLVIVVFLAIVGQRVAKYNKQNLRVNVQQR
jgi:hypothetical protein